MPLQLYATQSTLILINGVIRLEICTYIYYIDASKGFAYFSPALKEASLWNDS